VGPADDRLDRVGVAGSMKATRNRVAVGRARRPDRWPRATGPPDTLGVLHGLAGRSLRRRSPARRVSR
jgi:hypothetical protein